MRKENKIFVAFEIALILLILCDLITTEIFLKNPKITEGNPYTKWFLTNWGITGLQLDTVILVIAALSFPLINEACYRFLETQYKKSHLDKRLFIIFSRVIMILCFLILSLAVIERAVVVANNIYWIIFFGG